MKTRLFVLTMCAALAVNVCVGADGAPSPETAKYIIIPVAGGQQAATIFFSEKIAAAGAWTASSNQEWCTVPASGSGEAVAISATENTNILPRRAVVTIKSGDVEKKIAVAQEPKLTPNLSLSWTDTDGKRHDSIPADKKFWNTGEVLEYNRATVGKGANIVIFNDAFNKMEMAVGGVYETSAKEAAELFLAMPVVRDYKDHFNISILMRVWDKSGLYNQYPDGTFRALWDRQENRFLPLLRDMPQLKDVPHEEVSLYYFAHGMAGGYMWTGRTGFRYASYCFGAEPNYPYWTIHEMMGHCFASLGDMYQAPRDYSKWDFILKDKLPVKPVTADSWKLREWALNCRVVEWNQEAWDAFIALPGNEKYADNLDKYRKSLPSNYRAERPNYTGGDYIWEINYDRDFMNQHHLWSSAWSRYLVYRAVMQMSGQPYSLVDFFANDQKYIDVTDWHGFLGLHGWKHSYQYDPHNKESGSPFAPWDVPKAE